jgi:hypothetical protein
MKARDILDFGGNVFELEKGDGVRRPGRDDAVKIEFGGIETGLTFREIPDNPSLPFALEEENLWSVWVAYDSSFGDGGQWNLAEAVFAVIPTMTLGQKVMIVEDKADKDGKEFPKEWGKGVNI